MTLAEAPPTTDRTTTPLLELRDIRAAYDGINVLRGIDLVVPEATVVAVLGPNGAGKTTTLKVAAGLHPASGGDILVAGRRVNGARPDELARHNCIVSRERAHLERRYFRPVMKKPSLR